MASTVFCLSIFCTMSPGFITGDREAAQLNLLSVHELSNGHAVTTHWRLWRWCGWSPITMHICWLHSGVRLQSWPWGVRCVVTSKLKFMRPGTVTKTACVYVGTLKTYKSLVVKKQLRALVSKGHACCSRRVGNRSQFRVAMSGAAWGVERHILHLASCPTHTPLRTCSSQAVWVTSSSFALHEAGTCYKWKRSDRYRLFSSPLSSSSMSTWASGKSGEGSLWTHCGEVRRGTARDLLSCQVASREEDCFSLQGCLREIAPQAQMQPPSGTLWDVGRGS